MKTNFLFCNVLEIIIKQHMIILSSFRLNGLKSTNLGTNEHAISNLENWYPWIKVYSHDLNVNKNKLISECENISPKVPGLWACKAKIQQQKICNYTLFNHLNRSDNKSKPFEMFRSPIRFFFNSDCNNYALNNFFICFISRSLV